MGLTYNPKPAFIETLIEAGSAHYLNGAAELFAFAAEFEAAGGEASPDNKNIGNAVWHLSRAVDHYRSLLSSLEGIEVAPQTLQMIRDLVARPNIEAKLSSSLIGPTQQIGQMLAAAKGGDPKGPIRVFTERAQRTLDAAKQVQMDVENETCNVMTVQAALSSVIDCYLIGYYIAEFNLLSRNEFAPA